MIYVYVWKASLFFLPLGFVGLERARRFVTLWVIWNHSDSGRTIDEKAVAAPDL